MPVSASLRCCLCEDKGQVKIDLTHPPHVLSSGRDLFRQTCKRRVFLRLYIPMVINRTPFHKPATTPERLLQKLEQQGVIVDDGRRQSALDYMRFVGGYRLKEIGFPPDLSKQQGWH